jgi:hypothetical protein
VIRSYLVRSQHVGFVVRACNAEEALLSAGYNRTTAKVVPWEPARDLRQRLSDGANPPTVGFTIELRPFAGHPWDRDTARAFPEIAEIRTKARCFMPDDVSYREVLGPSEIELASQIFVAQYTRDANDSASDQLLAQEALAAARAFLEEAGTSRS